MKMRWGAVVVAATMVAVALPRVAISPALAAPVGGITKVVPLESANPLEVIFSPDGSTAYISEHETVGKVAKIDASTDTVVSSATVGDHPIGLALFGSSLYVANRNDNTASAVNTSDMTSTSIGMSLNGSGFPFRDAVSPDGAKLYVANGANGSSNTVSVIDTSSKTETGTIAVGSNPFEIGRAHV